MNARHFECPLSCNTRPQAWCSDAAAAGMFQFSYSVRVLRCAARGPAPLEAYLDRELWQTLERESLCEVFYQPGYPLL